MTREQIIAESRDWIGTPYHHQASLKGVGCDCLGLVRGIYRALYGPEPARVAAYAQWGDGGDGERLILGLSAHLNEVPTPGAPGDIVVFRLREGSPARHCGVLIEPRRFVHAVSARGVFSSALSPWWWRHLAGCFEFPGIKD